ncbi:putative membrane protein YfcA [Pseudomonas sp. TE3786]
MKNEQNSNEGDGFTALCCAFLAAVIVLAVQWCVGAVAWLYVLIAAAFGFYLGLRYGQRAVDFLKDIFSWA